MLATYHGNRAIYCLALFPFGASSIDQQETEDQGMSFNGLICRGSEQKDTFIATIHFDENTLINLSIGLPFYHSHNSMEGNYYYRINRFLPRHLESAFQPPVGAPAPSRGMFFTL